MQKMLPFSLVALLVSGCFGAKYDHPTANQSQFLKDRYECVRDLGVGRNKDGSSCVQGFSACMAAKGYSMNRSNGRLIVSEDIGVNAC